MSTNAQYRVNVADSTCETVKQLVEAKKVTNACFIAAQKEIELFLDLDVFPRYQTWCETNLNKKSSLTRQKTDASLLDKNRLGDREKMREAVVALLSIEQEQKNMRKTALKLDAEENIDFYLDIKAYQLLFDPKDRIDNSRRIFSKYLDEATAHRLVNLPDETLKALGKAVNSDSPTGAKDLWDKALKETLHLITDNIYPAYLKENPDAHDSSDPATATDAPQAGKIPDSGGCCVIS